MNPVRLCCLIVLLLAGCNLSEPATVTPAPQSTTAAARLVVAWAEAGNLLVWQTGDTFPRRVASGGVVRPYIAPDGEHIAYTRGANGAAETLWIVDTAGTAEQQLVGERPRGYVPGAMQIGDVVWLDGQILFFNTLRQAVPAFIPQDDLYRANIRTREVAALLNPGQGGRMYPSPDRQWIAVVSAGSYGRQDGRIAVIDPLGRSEARDLLYFVGVASGSERPFYPALDWLADSSAVMVAIPDKDLLYSETDSDEDVPLTALWRLPVENPSERSIIGRVQASLFGMPRWSADGSGLLWLQRIPNTNAFIANLGFGDGSGEVELFRGDASAIQQPQWITGSNEFGFLRIEQQRPVAYSGGLRREMEQLPEAGLLALRFLSPDVRVVLVERDGRIEMRAHLNDGTTQYIGATGATIPTFDALFIDSAQ